MRPDGTPDHQILECYVRNYSKTIQAQHTIRMSETTVLGLLLEMVWQVKFGTSSKRASTYQQSTNSTHLQKATAT